MSVSRFVTEQSSGPRLEEPSKALVLLLGWAFLQQDLTCININVDEPFRFSRAFQRQNSTPSLFRRPQGLHHH